MSDRPAYIDLVAEALDEALAKGLMRPGALPDLPLPRPEVPATHPWWAV